MLIGLVFKALYSVQHAVLKGDPYMHNKFCSSDSIPLPDMNR